MADDIKDQLCEQNEWIIPAEFDITDCYTTTLDNATFKTIIANCSFEMHEILLERGHITSGLKKKFNELMDSNNITLSKSQKTQTRNYNNNNKI